MDVNMFERDPAFSQTVWGRKIIALIEPALEPFRKASTPALRLDSGCQVSPEEAEAVIEVLGENGFRVKILENVRSLHVLAVVRGKTGVSLLTLEDTEQQYLSWYYTN